MLLSWNFSEVPTTPAPSMYGSKIGEHCSRYSKGPAEELTVEDFLLRTEDLGDMADVEDIARLKAHK